MNKALLMRYLMLAVQESQARVPNQLLPASDSEDEVDDEPSEEGVNEFCSVGSGTTMGYGSTLGGQRKARRK